jgi:NADPH:quinone reductase
VRAVQITRFGGPEVLEVVDLPVPVPEGGSVLLQVSAAGVNYADTHQTENTYLARQTLPLVPGAEVVGRTPDGRRVVALLAGGGYAEQAVAHPALTYAVPDEVSDTAALAVVLQGTTAWHMLRSSAHLAEGETVVVHAGAGGVGTLAVQLAKAFGAGRVIATASTEDKRKLTLELGADVAVSPEAEGLKDRLREANDGKPVDVVLEMTGGAVFDASLRALAPLGRLAVFGMAGRVPAHDIPAGMLMARSTAVIGFWLVHVVQRPAMLAEAVTDLLGMLERGELRAVIGKQYSLDTVADAHRSLLDRSSVGKLILIP